MPHKIKSVKLKPEGTKCQHNKNPGRLPATSAVADKLTEYQHSHHKDIVSALHVHLNSQHCLEVVVLKGKAKKIKKLAEELIGTKGVKHGKLMTTTTGEGIL